MRVLGIETSCDETGVAVYDSEQGLLAQRLYSQIPLHRPFGGVVPELASRDHILRVLPLVDEVINESGPVDAIAYTAGPGLVGALLIGAMVGRSLAYAWDVPAIGVHHMEAHMLAVMLSEPAPDIPFVALVVSGGHTLLVEVSGIGDYRILGQSLDDAAGEAFDKTAKLMGLPYPGGPEIAKLAEQGDAKAFDLPRPMLDQSGLDFSFSGLKTAVVHTVKKINELTDEVKADLSASFQAAAVDVLVTKCKRALKYTGLSRLVLVGGVAANLHLREEMAKLDVDLYYPDPSLCTDNGAMIAYTGCQHLLNGQRDGLAVQVHPRWAF